MTVASMRFLADFGVTKQRAVDTNLTATGFAIGTADYMAPEQPLGNFQALSGAVLYDHGSELEKLWAHVNKPRRSLLDVRPGLPLRPGQVVARALAKTAADRYPTAGGFAREAFAAVHDHRSE